mgnify:CR=1 FL=1
MIINPIINIWIMTSICIFIILIGISKKNKRDIITKAVISFLLFMINLRIMIPTSDGKMSSNNLDVLFVIDNTISMVAEDYDGNKTRLEGVKNDCKYIIENLSGAKFSVITFSNSSKIDIPFTNDIDAAYNVIDSLDVMISMYAKGSSLNEPFKDMEYVLDNSVKNTSRKRIVFFVSDGEITNGKQLESYANLRKNIDSGAVLGYGTNEGGKMKVKKYAFSDSLEYLEDDTQNIFPYPKAISKIDEGNLQQIASDLGIEYINMQKTSDVDQILKKISRDISKDTQKLDINTCDDTYYIFAIILTMVLLFELINYKRRIAI